MQLEIFKFRPDEEQLFNDITTIEIDGEIWFLANDVCKALDITNVSDAVSRLDEEEKLTSVLPISGQNRNVNIINESGLYTLIFKSRKSSAQQFRKWITKEVIPSIRKKGYYGKIDRAQLPNFVERYKDNIHQIPGDYFSVISEMYVRMYAELEKVGYSIPDIGEHGKKMCPDISVGRGFAKFLKDNDSEYYNTHKTYKHKFPDGRVVDANMYKIDALPIFIRYVNERWLFTDADRYFRDKDPLALEYLPRLLELKKKQ